MDLEVEGSPREGEDGGCRGWEGAEGRVEGGEGGVGGEGGMLVGCRKGEEKRNEGGTWWGGGQTSVVRVAHVFPIQLQCGRKCVRMQQNKTSTTREHANPIF